VKAQKGTKKTIVQLLSGRQNCGDYLTAREEKRMRSTGSPRD